MRPRNNYKPNRELKHSNRCTSRTVYRNFKLATPLTQTLIFAENLRSNNSNIYLVGITVSKEAKNK